MSVMDNSPSSQPTPETPNPSIPPEIPPKVPARSKKFPLIIIVVTLLIALLTLAASAYTFYTNPKLPQIFLSPTPTTITQITTTPTPADVTANWKTFTNDDYEFKYPSDLYAMEVSAIQAGIYLKEIDGQKAEDCLKAGKETLVRTCEEYRVLNIGVIKSTKDTYKKAEQLYPQTNPNLPRLTTFNDRINRTWTILKVSTSTTTNIHAELETKDSFYIVSIYVNNIGFDQYTTNNSSINDGEKSHIEIAQQILSTFKFTGTNSASSPVNITEKDNGKTFYYKETERFSVSLDIKLHPLKVMYDPCDNIGYVSNLSINGPDDYPIGYEATTPGICVIKNGNFSVTINIIK